MNGDTSINKHLVLEQVMEIYLKLKRTCKTHWSVLDRNGDAVRMIEKPVSVGDNETMVISIKKEKLMKILVKRIVCM